MAFSIWFRPLDKNEELYLRNKKFMAVARTLGPLSVVGPEDHTWIAFYRVELQSRRIYVGEGQYIDESFGSSKAQGGQKVAVLWGTETCFSYIFNAAEELGISVIYDTNASLHYFETSHQDALIKAFTYADRALWNWSQSRSIFSKCFGAVYPDFNSKEALAIRAGIVKILTA